MRPNVACSDGEIDFQGLYWTTHCFFVIDSMKPEGRFSQYVSCLKNSTDIIFLQQRRQETKTKPFPENCSQLNALALNALCDSVNTE